MIGLEMTRQEKEFILQGIAAWTPMPFIAVLTAALRDEMLRPMLGPEWAGFLGGLTLLASLYACAWFFLTRVITPCAMCAPIIVGAIWVGLSVAFEFFLTVIWLREPIAEFARIFGYANFGEGHFTTAALVLLLVTPYVFSSTLRGGARA